MTKAKKQEVNTRERSIKVRHELGFDMYLPNPNYCPPESEAASKAVHSMPRATEMYNESVPAADRPKLAERIQKALEAYAAITSDRLIVLTDDPQEMIRGIYVPPDKQNAPTSGVVVMCGAEAAEKFPGLAVGCRVVYHFTAGTALPFANGWEARILRYSQVEVILKDESAKEFFKEGK